MLEPKEEEGLQMSTCWAWHHHAIQISQQLQQPTLGSTKLSLNYEA